MAIANRTKLFLITSAAISIEITGFLILMAFAGSVYIEPAFEGQALVFKGLAILFILMGVRLQVLVNIPRHEQMTENVMMLKRICIVGILISFYIIGNGLYVMNTS